MIANGHGRPLDFANDYLSVGCSVVPILADGSKKPTVRWKDYQQRRATRDEIAGWYLADNLGIAIICGAVSGNVEVIDIDDDAIFPAYRDEIERSAPGLLDRITQVQTPRPGRHLIYRCPQIERNQKLAEAPDPDNPDRPKAIIETRGEGGYVLAVGSPGACHDSGREYVHAGGPPLTEIPEITPEEREKLFRAARLLNQWVDHEPQQFVAHGAQQGGLSPGDDFNARATWQEILEPHGWRCDHTEGEVIHWRRPGKDRGTSATTGLRARRSGRELFCVFSSNACPFDADSNHDKFGAYARLNHEGDLAAAARELGRKGYGEQRPKNPWAARPEGFIRSRDEAGEPGDDEPPLVPMSVAALAAQHSKLNEPLIEGLLRRQEVANLIAAPKMGKSWLAHGLALCVATGRPWLDEFDTNPGRVLLLDNELHPATLNGRIQTVADAMGIPASEYSDGLDVLPLRGRLRSLYGLAALMDQIAGQYALIVLDAWYRLIPSGVSENGNSEIAQLFNEVDRYAATTGASFVLIHHSSKGGQGDKSVVDVGAGAGSQARAADSHMVLREHEEPGVVVLDAAVRSWAPIQPIPLRWTFPLWTADYSVDAEKLKARQTTQDRRQHERDMEGFAAITRVLESGPAVTRAIRESSGLSKDRVDRLLAKLHANGDVAYREVQGRGPVGREYWLTENTN